MWRVRELATREADLDFSSSEQGIRRVTQVIADGIVLANAVELTDWTEPSVQLVVCEHCGMEHCEPGGWVVPKSTGLHVILLPDFARMAEDDRARNEYRPPAYFDSRGIPVLDERLASTIAAFRNSRDLPLVTGSELVRAIQWTAPMNVLGRFPDPPRLRRDDIIATAESDLQQARDWLEAELERHERSDEGLILLAEPDPTRPIAFYLDRGTEWIPAYRTGDGMALALDTDLIARPASSP